MNGEWRIANSKWMFSILFLIFCLAGGCATSGSKSLLPPAFRPALDDSGELRVVTQQQFQTHVLDLTQLLVYPVMEDAAYLMPSHAWVKRFNEYIWERRQSLEYQGALGYQLNWPDCDDYSKLYVAAALLSNAARYPYPPLIGTINLRHAPGLKGPHQMIFYVSDRGLFLLEPQTGQETRLFSLAELLSEENADAVRAKLRKLGVFGVRVARGIENGEWRMANATPTLNISSRAAETQREFSEFRCDSSGNLQSLVVIHLNCSFGVAAPAQGAGAAFTFDRTAEAVSPYQRRKAAA